GLSGAAVAPSVIRASSNRRKSGPSGTTSATRLPRPTPRPASRPATAATTSSSCSYVSASPVSAVTSAGWDASPARRTSARRSPVTAIAATLWAPVGAAADELAAPALRTELAVIDDEPPAHDRLHRPADRLVALVRVEVGLRLHPLGHDSHPVARVDDRHVGIGADRDRPFARPHPEELRRVRRDDLDEPAQADAAGRDSGRVQHPHEALDIRHASRDGREAQRRIRLLRECPGRVVGRVRLDLAPRERLPQRVAVALLAK